MNERDSAVRLKLDIHGTVQGVGFRPFVFRLASELGLKGWVRNDPAGVTIEVEGTRARLDDFVARLSREKPALATFHALEIAWLDPAGFDAFEIRPSGETGARQALILPDIATCADCAREIRDPSDRRHRYPFTNCTHCGPRFSIIESLPYDRPRTAMKDFAMCPDCAREYANPADRRFHAQPIACPRCGPQLELWNADGHTLAVRDEALRQAEERIAHGEIVALKGLGGFQLIVDARNEQAVRRLRGRKRREEKPFAVMFPDWSSLEKEAALAPLHRQLLGSPASPIVLVERAAGGQLAESVAPHNPNLGVMLPYTPLHHLLLGDLGFPVVATSGNVSDEPMCIDGREAVGRLRGIADVFLVHNRPIVRPMDDSIVRVVSDRPMVLRRARGYAPLPVTAPADMPDILSVGAHQKSAVALGIGSSIFVSQHIGDLDSQPAHAAFRQAAEDLPRLYGARDPVIACDLHPDYLSSRYARERGEPIQVQHHYAHVLACMAENGLIGTVLGVAWDGTGYGLDGTIWGGEFLRADYESFERVSHFRTFPLPGGSAAVKQPRRTALGLLYEMYGEDAFERRALPPLLDFADAELPVLKQALARGINAPITSSAGRLFDGVASLLGLRQRLSFEGQAAMELEFAIRAGVEDAYPARAGKTIDWKPVVEALLEDTDCLGTRAARFHNTLVELIVEVARRNGIEQVVLTGGCFQNRYLSERAVTRLRAEGFRPYWHQRVPPNDGGIALGQVLAAANQCRRASKPVGTVKMLAPAADEMS